MTLRGDGGFSMWSTAVECGLPAVWVVMNNFAIGTIRDLQRFYLDGGELGTSFVNQATGEFWNPDFASMAKAMGAQGVRIEHPDEFGDASTEALKSSTPTALDAIVNRDTGIPVTGTWQMPTIPEVQPTFGQRKVL